MYRVIKGFYDLQDSGHWYSAGDPYPRQGHSPSAKRIAELAGVKNRQHAALIVEEPEKKEKPVRAKVKND